MLGDIGQVIHHLTQSVRLVFHQLGQFPQLRVDFVRKVNQNGLRHVFDHIQAVIHLYCQRLEVRLARPDHPAIGQLPQKFGQQGISLYFACFQQGISLYFACFDFAFSPLPIFFRLILHHLYQSRRCLAQEGRLLRKDRNQFFSL